MTAHGDEVRRSTGAGPSFSASPALPKPHRCADSKSSYALPYPPQTARRQVCVPRWLALSSASVTPSRPCHVSSPRRVEEVCEVYELPALTSRNDIRQIAAHVVSRSRSAFSWRLCWNHLKIGKHTSELQSQFHLV